MSEEKSGEGTPIRDVQMAQPMDEAPGATDRPGKTNES
jgi:hypothetical protein